jgi:transcriptional regulator with XRE-family HTH domain
MAESLKISANSYRELENGSIHLINPRLEQIATILKIPLESLIFGNISKEEYLKKIADIEKEFQEKLTILKSSHKIEIAEKDGEISILKESLKTKESIIGVLKERLPEY